MAFQGPGQSQIHGIPSSGDSNSFDPDDDTSLPANLRILSIAMRKVTNLSRQDITTIASLPIHLRAQFAKYFDSNGMLVGRFAKHPPEGAGIIQTLQSFFGAPAFGNYSGLRRAHDTDG